MWDNRARQNEPAKLREFASTIEKLTSLPGVSSYAAPIHAVASVLARSADQQAAKAPKPAKPVRREPERPKDRRLAATQVPDETDDGVVALKVDLTEDSSPRPPVTAPLPEIQGGTVVPVVETGAIPCQVGAPLGASMLCLTAAIGPMVLTDIHASGECRTDLFVIDGPPGAPRWVVQIPARTALHITGARLYARPGEPIAIVVPERPRAGAVRDHVEWGEAVDDEGKGVRSPHEPEPEPRARPSCRRWRSRAAHRPGRVGRRRRQDR
jgi:hypothetical protein